MFVFCFGPKKIKNDSNYTFSYRASHFCRSSSVFCKHYWISFHHFFSVVGTFPQQRGKSGLCFSIHSLNSHQAFIHSSGCFPMLFFRDMAKLPKVGARFRLTSMMHLYLYCTTCSKDRHIVRLLASLGIHTIFFIRNKEIFTKSRSLTQSFLP